VERKQQKLTGMRGFNMVTFEEMDELQNNRQLSLDDYIKSIGGEKHLTHQDAKELSAGCRRVLELMKDGAWHTPDEICLAAGKNGIPAREGLRRARELRRLGYLLECEKGNGRNFKYRLRAAE